MRKLPIGIQTFEDIIKNDYLYVDKTQYIWELEHTGKVYFLSRPRRFGKSLFLSTEKAYFEGKKGLFRGLKIAKLKEQNNEQWESYPIIHMSFGTGNYLNEDELDLKINSILTENAAKYQIPDNKNDTYGDRFLSIIKNIYEKTDKGVVVLIDEYDKPLLDNLSVNENLEEKNRGTLKGFFGALKDADPYLKFVFIIGVTKFSKVSIFSDLNQLKDISLKAEYSGICGISEREMLSTFYPEIEEMAEKLNISTESCIDKLREFYDGYHFSDEGDGLFNPYSLLNAFSDKRINMYWFATGTPTFLINSLRNSGMNIESFTDGVSASIEDMSEFRMGNANVIPLFYQSGYLTIKDYNPLLNEYTLVFPNAEVRYGFYKSLVPTLSPKYAYELGKFSMTDMIRYLSECDVDSFMRMIQGLLASIPYYEGNAPQNEQEWRNVLYVIFALLGQYVQAESHSSKGRCDFSIENEHYVYIFEFKYDKSADEALKQINDSGYAVPYVSSKKKIVKIGANFSSVDRTLDSWKVEQ